MNRERLLRATVTIQSPVKESDELNSSTYPPSPLPLLKAHNAWQWYEETMPHVVINTFVDAFDLLEAR